ncbi:hypothetical protein ACFFHM_03245 [Halalkalibacter kiskunsagensis]|uniref:Terminase n=1 Tax=Halalkalibacter kiskunsagensis TaxID=1548599 RepID=A0ABV6K8D7_9BACI
MARGTTTSVSELKRHITKAELTARKEAEAQVVTNQTTPKASPMLSKEERKLFNKIKKRSTNFTEADSESLNLLVHYLNRWYTLKQLLDDLDPLDEQATDIERRMIALDKQITVHMSALCLPLSQRLRLANDLAKVLIEEKKLASMNGQQKVEVNPALAILEALK